MTFRINCTDNSKKHLTNRQKEFIIVWKTLYGGDNMAMATIDRVREAERKAAQQQDEAELRAEQIVADAHAKAKKIVADAQASVSADVLHRMAEARAQAQQKLRARREEAEADADALKQKTMKLRQNIINQLIRESLL